MNPVAGGNTCLRRFNQLEPMLRREKADYSVVYSEYPGHASELARQALVAGRDIVVAVGGDGTAREVAQELLNTGVPMGVLPLGTGNDLIRALEIPAEPEWALDLLLNEQPQPIDAASVGDKIFLNVAGFGFDVDVLEKTRRYKDRFHGRFSYILGLLHALLSLRTRRVRVTTPQGAVEEEVLLISVGNGTYIGGGMRAVPGADIADGLLDVCLVRRVGRLKVLRFLPKFIRGEHLGMDFVYYFRAESIAVACDEPAPVQLDGEIIDQLPATFRVLPAALLMVTGKEAPEAAALASLAERTAGL